MNILIVGFEAGRSGPARLVKPLQQAGLQVAALCPSEDPLAHTRYLAMHFALTNVTSSRRVGRALADVMQSWRPDLVIPADERAVACLHAIVRTARAGGRSPLDAVALDILVTSLGDPAQYDAMLLKNYTQDLARRHGVQIPAGATVAGREAAHAAAARVGYPCYVKAPFSWAGQGVTLCQDQDAVTAALLAAQGRQPSRLRAWIKSRLHRDWYPAGQSVDIQQAIVGKPAMYVCVALGGVLLAGFSGTALKTRGENGPSSVVALGPHAAMRAASERMVRALGATGFLSFDFMIASATGEAYLLECNPRPNQVGHLGAHVGIDLCAALAAAMRGRPLDGAQEVGRATVALFPHGSDGTPGSVVAPCNDDVPWDDPALLAAMMPATQIAN